MISQNSKEWKVEIDSNFILNTEELQQQLYDQIRSAFSQFLFKNQENNQEQAFIDFCIDKINQQISLIKSQNHEIQYTLSEQQVLQKQNTSRNLIQLINQTLQSSEENLSLSFTRQEVFTLLLMMYCNVLRNNFQLENFYLSNMEQIKHGKTPQSVQKHRCIINYFKSFFANKENYDEMIIFRKSNQNTTVLQNDIIISNFEQTSKKIQDIKSGDIIVDFADSRIGGFVLDDTSLAQEQIIMLEHPEAIISTLIFKPLKKGEAILISNAIHYNDSEGYQDSFRWKEKNFYQTINHHILAIDAIQYSAKDDQFEEKNWSDELLKCYSGFKLALTQHPNATISAGKWGCGLFNGNPEVKFLLQLFGFSLAKQELKLEQNVIRFSSSQNLNYFNISPGCVVNYQMLQSFIQKIKIK